MKNLHCSIAVRSVCVALLSGVVLSAGSVAASDIYRWTDANGNVHYGDRPTGADTEQRLQITSRPTDPTRIQRIVEARQDARAAGDAAAAERAAGEPSAEELRARAEERRAKCEMYKERLQRFVTSRRLYREDENGERVYLDEQQALDARARVQEQVEEHCSNQ